MNSAKTFDVKHVLENLPALPGVYRMLDSQGAVLYVGKARDLKKRVSSYFQKTDLTPRIRLMVTQIAAIETTVVRTEAEALLLENHLIKALNPRYNILFRDDKSYPYVMLSGHRFPRLAYYRGEPDRQHQYFGPYPGGFAVRETMHLLQRVFLLRTCEDSSFQNRSRPCLLFQIKRCTAPCVGKISEQSYQDDVRRASLFLQGKDDELLAELHQRMNSLAERLDYEQAAIIRDQISSLNKLREKQFVSSNDPHQDVDVIVCVTQADTVCVNLAMIRAGRHLGDKSYFPLNADGCHPSEALEAFMAQHYQSVPVPSQIVVNDLQITDDLSSLLVRQAGRKVSVAANPVGDKRIWLDMALKNADIAITQRLGRHVRQLARLEALQASLALDGDLQRVECFDISHTMGEATVASCVVFDRQDMQPGEYRRFNISGITPGDDFAAMRDVMTRRYGKLAEGGGVLPDLILIDGGVGQVAIAENVLAEIGLEYLPVVGVAKGEGRKPGLETLIIPRQQKKLQLPADHPALHLIQQIRDEAHRFAITGHRQRRAKKRLNSALENISGVGPVRRQKLLVHFGGLKGIKAASVAELTQVEGISLPLAEAIYRALH